jgi:hypothetical protein
MGADGVCKDNPEPKLHIMAGNLSHVPTFEALLYIKKSVPIPSFLYHLTSSPY